MTNEARDRIRARFLRDATPARLGAIAANLSRVESFGRRPGGRNVVKAVLNESTHFVDWASPCLDAQNVASLHELKQQLDRWLSDFDALWDDPERRDELVRSADQWSQRLLQLSGLAETLTAR